MNVGLLSNFVDNFLNLLSNLTMNLESTQDMADGGWFGAFRHHHQNTWYAQQRVAAIFDITGAIILYIIALIAVAFVFILIGARNNERYLILAKVAVNLYFGGVLLSALFGCHWQEAEANTHSAYSMASNDIGKVDIGVKIGLKYINITLNGYTKRKNSTYQIDYNEKFSIDKVHDMEEAYKSAMHKGLPYSILYVAEYFSYDEGGLRWNRGLRMSGHFTNILLWCSLAVWAVSILVFNILVSRAILLLVISGSLQTCACVLYDYLQFSYPLIISFEDAHIKLHYGWCYWLVLANGLLMIGIAAVLFGCLRLDREKFLTLMKQKKEEFLTTYLDSSPIEFEMMGNQRENRYSKRSFSFSEDDSLHKYIGVRPSNSSIKENQDEIEICPMDQFHENAASCGQFDNGAFEDDEFTNFENHPSNNNFYQIDETTVEKCQRHNQERFPTLVGRELGKDLLFSNTSNIESQLFRKNSSHNLPTLGNYVSKSFSNIASTDAKRLVKEIPNNNDAPGKGLSLQRTRPTVISLDGTFIISKYNKNYISQTKSESKDVKTRQSEDYYKLTKSKRSSSLTALSDYLF